MAGLPGANTDIYTTCAQLLFFLHQLSPVYRAQNSENEDELDNENDDLASNDSLEALEGDLELGEEEDTQTSGSSTEYKKLVDAIAFIASTEKKASHVTSVAMEVGDNKSDVCFRVAMNGSVTSTVLDDLRKLGKTLTESAKKLDSTGNASELQQIIFNLIVEIKKVKLATQLRGGTGSIGLLREFKEACRRITLLGQVRYSEYSDTLDISVEEQQRHGPYNRETHMRHMVVAETTFKSLHQLVKNACFLKKAKKSKTSSRINLQPAKELILLAFENRNSRCLNYFLNQGSLRTQNKLFRSLRKLSRYWQCALDLVECISSKTCRSLFEKILFVPVEKAIARQPDPQREMSVEDLVLFCGCPCEELDRYCDKTGRRVLDIKSEHRQWGKKPLYVHAEVNLLLYYRTHPEIKPERELGCSKNSCYPCQLFIKHNGSFDQEKTHNKIYIGWGLPDVQEAQNELTGGLAEIVGKIVEDLKLTIKKALEKPEETKSTKIAPDSTSGVSSTVVGAQTTKQKRASHPYYTPEDMDRDPFLVYAREREGPDEVVAAGVSSVEEPIPYIAHGRHNDSYAGECKACDEPTTRRCSKCHSVFYCTLHCEVELEGLHVFKCNPGRPLDSADYLVRCAIQDRLPEADEAEGFGFDRCKNGKERSYLLGLYIGLIVHLDTRSRSLHKWQQENTLAENICKVYEDAGQNSGYYRWFLENKHLVDAQTPKKSLLESHLDLEALKKYLPAADRDTQLINLKPDTKRDVALVYAMLMAHYRPSPGQPQWQSFGFCTCRSQWAESGLVDFYQDLFKKASFDEVWRAYDKHSLDKLAIQKGMQSKLNKLASEDIFPVPPPYSCYDLKEYTECGNITQPPVRPVVFDYGFMLCKNARERQLWLDTYTRVFKHRDHKDRDLHQACIEGRIFQYVKKLLPDTPNEFALLCKNIYPLKDVE